MIFVCWSFALSIFSRNRFSCFSSPSLFPPTYCMCVNAVSTRHAILIFLRSRTLLHLTFCTFMSWDNGGQLRKKEAGTASEQEAASVAKRRATGGGRDEGEDGAQVINPPQGSGDAIISRSFQEDSTPQLGAEGKVEDTPGDNCCFCCGVAPTNGGTLRVSRQDMQRSLELGSVYQIGRYGAVGCFSCRPVV